MRGRGSEVGERLWQLAGRNEAAICGQVWVEFIGGVRREAERREYEGGSAPFRSCRRRARRSAAPPAVSPGILASAIENGARLFTLDADFRPLEREGLELF